MGVTRDRQGGYIREVIWFTVVVVIAAIALLDGISLVNASQKSRDAAAKAAEAARTAYAGDQRESTAAAAAKSFLAEGGNELVDFEIVAEGGSSVYKVTARSHAKTIAFHYLGKLGLAQWEGRKSNPVGSGTAR